MTSPDTPPVSADDSPREGIIAAAQRYTALIVGMILAGMVMSLALSSMTSLRGVPGPTIAEAITPVSAILALFGCLVVTFVIAVGVGRIVNPAVGTFVLGAGVGTVALGSGSHLDLLFAGVSGPMVAVETLVWGGVVLVLAAGIHRLTGPLPDQPEQSAADAVNPTLVFSPLALRSAGAGIFALIVVFLFASNDLKGQALAAAVIAGIATGHIGRVLAPKIQPILLYAAPAVFLAIGQLVVFGGGADDLIATWMQDGGPRLAIPTPVDVAAGSLMGVSMGIGFSRGFVEAHAGR